VSVPCFSRNNVFHPLIETAFADGLPFDAFRDTVLAQAAKLTAVSGIRDARRVILTASGDSLFAAMAVLPAFRRWTGLPAEVMTSVEFARYEVPLVQAGDVVIAVSNSGNSSRTRESLILARTRGALTVGVTGNSEGPFSRIAEWVLHRPVKESIRIDVRHRRALLNIVEYVATLLTLFMFAVELGAGRSHLTTNKKQLHLQDITEAFGAIPAAAASIEQEIAETAPTLADTDTLFALGAGPNRGTAYYAAAKFHEQLARNGVVQDLEEWAHLQYFLTLTWRERAVVIVHSPIGNSLDRAMEIVTGIADAGGRPIVITSPDAGRFERAWKSLTVGPAMNEMLTPILFHLPAQLFVLHLAELSGVKSMPIPRRDDYWLIRKGLVLNNPSGLA
jgi:glucosamine--fructose-6-phosphate aminotransferase (isomerizing)